jgi:hypothetical protein
MATAGRISAFLNERVSNTNLPDLSLVTSLMSIVVAVAFFAGIAYAAVAIPSQTQLQEDLPEEVRGRVFGVLNMLVSVSSFLPILIVGPMADLLAKIFPNEGTTIILVVVAGLIVASGILSIYLRGAAPCDGADGPGHGRRPRRPVRPGAGRGRSGRQRTNVEFLDEDADITSPPHPVQEVSPAVAGIPASLTELEPPRGRARECRAEKRGPKGRRAAPDRLSVAHGARRGRLHGGARSACATTPWPAATCRFSAERTCSRPFPVSTRSPRWSRSTSG